MELWSTEHLKTLLPATAIMLVLTVVLRIILKNKSHKVRMIPIQIVACLIFLLEIGKQVMSARRGYDLYHLPFHFCSLLIFMLPLMAFYRGKHKQIIYGITSALCMSVCLLTLIYPCLIYSAGNIREFTTDFFSFHTVAFHNLAVWVGFLIPAMGVHEPANTKNKHLIFFTLGFCAVSATMAQSLKTNFNNFYTCNIAPLEAVRQTVENACGAVPAMILYVLIVTVMDVLFVLGSYQVYKLVRRLFCGKEAPIAVQ